MIFTLDEWGALFALLDRAPKSPAEALWVQAMASRVNEMIQKEQLKPSPNEVKSQ